MHLSDWMTLKEARDGDLAEVLAVDRSTIAKLRLRQAEPSFRLARKIQRITKGKVTLMDWPEVAA